MVFIYLFLSSCHLLSLSLWNAHEHVADTMCAHFLSRFLARFRLTYVCVCLYVYRKPWTRRRFTLPKRASRSRRWSACCLMTRFVCPLAFACVRVFICEKIGTRTKKKTAKHTLLNIDIHHMSYMCLFRVFVFVFLLPLSDTFLFF